MEKPRIARSELVLTDDGRIYHLKLKPEDLGELIFLVGDPGRVKVMSRLFDSVTAIVENREFVTHTGYYRKKKVSVISTGIGTDNIDIVINELDALVNIDLETRTVKDVIKSLTLIRIGTSGALHEDIDPGSVILSEVAGGLDNLLYYYQVPGNILDTKLSQAFSNYMSWPEVNSRPYFLEAPGGLVEKVRNDNWFSGITLSAPGFYAPQGRSLRIPVSDREYIDKISTFRYGGLRINNFEMEGSALYGLSALLGHSALTACIALANRKTGKFITDYQPYIRDLLEKLLNLFTGDGA